MVLSTTTLKLLSFGTVVDITSTQSGNYLTLVYPSSMEAMQLLFISEPCDPCTALPV